jgi:hypothetical protein
VALVRAAWALVCAPIIWTNVRRSGHTRAAMAWFLPQTAAASPPFPILGPIEAALAPHQRGALPLSGPPGARNLGAARSARLSATRLGSMQPVRLVAHPAQYQKGDIVPGVLTSDQGLHDRGADALGRPWRHGLT